MTDHTIQPGCYGSALFYSVNASECVACPAFATCGKIALERSQTVIALVKRYDERFRTDRAPAVGKWIVRRFLRDVVRERSTKQAQAVLDRLRADGVNVYHLKHRTNPVETPGLLRDVFAFMIAEGPFKPRDAVEHLALTYDQSKAALTRQVKEVCDALVHAAILKKENHVLCLT